MHASEIHNLFRVHDPITMDTALRKAWLNGHTTCKDVLALAFPLRPLPHSQDSFKQKLVENAKQQDFVIANFYIIYVGLVDGQDWGWSKAPFDSKNKKREEQKPLYTAETDDKGQAQTRFWSFKKVSNNMNKGARIDDKVEDKDLSFSLPAGSCMSVFLREDSYDPLKSMFDGKWTNNENDDESSGMIAAYQPVLLQLSGTNDEQCLKGNGVKLRRVFPVAPEILNSFCDCFYSTRANLQNTQAAIADIVSLRASIKQQAGCPLLCRVRESAFLYRDPAAGVVEIIDSGMDEDMGKRLIISEQLLLSAMNSKDVNRSLRMLSVAIGHKAVRCLFVQAGRDSGASSSDACTVVHMHVDMAETMLLNLFHKSKIVDNPTLLPKTNVLTMCFGKSISKNLKDVDVPGFVDEEDMNAYLQWYAPNNLLQVAKPDGSEVLCNVVFEMELVMKQSAGQRDVPNKLLFMDEVAGFHYVVKIFHAKRVVFTEEDGLVCDEPKLLVTWQLRPGLLSSALSIPGLIRRREHMSADNLDIMNCGHIMDAETMCQDQGSARKKVAL